ncbi:hypothetical protein BH10ACT4_BH10ACT4_11380 [soil metagenome]
MNSIQLVIVRLGSWAAELAQSIVAAFGGGNGDPTRLQGPRRLRQVKPQKRSVRRR